MRMSTVSKIGLGVIASAILTLPVAAGADTQAPNAAPPPVLRMEAQVAPARRADEGAGPFNRLVIRGATLIDGTGSPPRGPVDIVIEKNRIVDILQAGTPGRPM